MAPHSSTLAWKIPWTEEPGRLQSMGSGRVGHDWATSLSFLLSCIGEGNGNPLQCSCLENLRDGGAWWAAINGVTQSQTRLKWLSSSSSKVKWGHKSRVLISMICVQGEEMSGMQTQRRDHYNPRREASEPTLRHPDLGLPVFWTVRKWMSIV